MPRYYVTHKDKHGERHQIGDAFEAKNQECALEMILEQAGAEDDGNYEVSVEDTAPAMAHLLECAREIAADDPQMLNDYDGFERVMWHDDSDMDRFGLSCEKFRDLLVDVFATLEREANGPPANRKD